ncbi:hypothetical protein G5C66_03360 [Nocardioides sp. KC13]|uniref:Uncharacterized protein n=1 Tax=Nocardioides turkmenicus TaxID=2711220 RepID=A0A6M1R247_9ACTN|nr:hypothetical protein [Nocardioides sp. KC13]NGN91778.1 hypothetical protein [Nocardioides sp. KC13]
MGFVYHLSTVATPKVSKSDEIPSDSPLEQRDEHGYLPYAACDPVTYNLAMLASSSSVALLPQTIRRSRVAAMHESEEPVFAMQILGEPNVMRREGKIMKLSYRTR